jgi:vacuolar-type H+-ATPase subunit E/Vma4
MGIDQTEKLKAILDRIEKDTNKECREIILAAEAKAKKIEQEIKKELDEKKANLMGRYKRLTESEKMRLIAEAKNKLLKERSIQKNQLVEDIIAKGLELSKKALNEKTIKKWIEDGLKNIGEKEVIITIPMRFKKLKLANKKILEKKIDDVIIESKDGAVRIIESLEKKMNENKNSILIEVSKILFS